MHYRHATASDIAAIVAIDSAVSPQPLAEQLYQQYCTDDRGSRDKAAFICEMEGQVAGFVIYYWVLDEANIVNIAVAPAFQGRGIGKYLLHKVLTEMKSVAVQRCLLEVRASNVAAGKLYRHSGFEVDGIRKAYYSTAEGGREDALLMSRTIEVE